VTPGPIACSSPQPPLPGAGDYFTRGRTYYEQGKAQAACALNDFTQAIALDPNFTAAYYYRGLICFNYRGDFRAAITEFTEAIDRDPTNTGAYYLRGESYYNTRQFQAAIADFTQALTRDPTNTGAYYLRGISYYNTQQVDAALADFVAAIKRDPKYDAAYSFLCTSLRNSSNLELRQRAEKQLRDSGRQPCS
jgi:tetratricopeptide (TPR) repeat protein